MEEPRIFEVRINHISNMNQNAKMEVIRKARGMNNFKGFAKITYVTASPKRISSIDPIDGTVIDYKKGTQARVSQMTIPSF
jgi:hypothetical protein